MEMYYAIAEKEYRLYQAASGDWCVSVFEYGKEREDYNIGSREQALEFILRESELEFIVRESELEMMED